jgi:hypothetical protein
MPSEAYVQADAIQNNRYCALAEADTPSTVLCTDAAAGAVTAAPVLLQQQALPLLL